MERDDLIIRNVLSKELEFEILSKYLPNLPHDHYAHKMWQEICYLRNKGFERISGV